MATADAIRFGYSEESWARLAATDRELLRRVQPAPRSQYIVGIPLGRLEAHLADEVEIAQRMGGTFTLTPDFQRGHVWDEARQVAYVENFLRGYAPAVFKFNCPTITGVKAPGDLPPYDTVCVDGLQRLKALRAFMADELVVFGDLRASQLRGTVMDPFRTVFVVQKEVFGFGSRAELLDYYIALNAGGVVHAAEEIARVQALADEARASAPVAPSTKPRRR